MNTNQDTTLTNQDFEKWLDTERGAGKAITEGMYRAYSAGHQAATKASEQRIQELEYLIDLDTELHENSAKTILELQAHVNQLREALNNLLNDCVNFDGGKLTDFIMHDATKTLASTPAQSLIEHDNALIERCKNIVANDPLAITFQSMGAYRSEIIRQIGALKASS